jgi:hypothetical protein
MESLAEEEFENPALDWRPYRSTKSPRIAQGLLDDGAASSVAVLRTWNPGRISELD